MEQHRQLVKQVAHEAPWHWKLLRASLFCAVLAGVLAAGNTDAGASFVLRVHAFLEFYSGVFALVGLSAVVVAGLVASGRFVPVRLRVLAQSGHRTLSVMSVTFLGVHAFLKVLEQHASALDVIVPFSGEQDRAFWIGLGTIASDVMVFVFATGVARGRFIGRARPWTWRILHIISYLCWPVAIVHGLNAGRAAKDWVTLSYVACLGAVAIVALVRLVSEWRRRETVRRMGGRPTGRAVRPATAPETHGIPDEQFWADLKQEVHLWVGSNR